MNEPKVNLAVCQRATQRSRCLGVYVRVGFPKSLLGRVGVEGFPKNGTRPCTSTLWQIPLYRGSHRQRLTGCRKAPGVVSELPNMRKVARAVNTSALLAIYPMECDITTNFEADFWPGIATKRPLIRNLRYLLKIHR